MSMSESSADALHRVQTVLKDASFPVLTPAFDLGDEGGFFAAAAKERLRDEFAMHALQGIIAVNDVAITDCARSEDARNAYGYADAMMKARAVLSVSSDVSNCRVEYEIPNWQAQQ